MQAIVFADRIGVELGQLCNKTTPANLPFLNRPLLEHCLIELSAAGVDEVLLVVSEDIGKTRKHFELGTVFGLSIEYVLSRGQENPTDVLKRVNTRLKTPFLVLRGDIYHGNSLLKFLQQSSSIDGGLLEASVLGQPAGLALLRRWPIELNGLGWPLSFTSDNRVRITAEHFSLLDSPKAYFDTQALLLKTASGAIPYASIQRDDGLWVEPMASVDPRSLWEGNCLVGENAHLHSSVILKGEIVIGRDCYISRGVKIENSIVLPGTYIGKNLNIENAIVDGGYIYSMHKNTSLKVDDPALMTNLTSDVELGVFQWQERLVAMAILFLSLPLWPIALIASWNIHRKHFTFREKILGNRAWNNSGVWERGVIEVWRFRTDIPVLSHLPMLLPVITGDLRLFGHEPMLACQLNNEADLWDQRLNMRASGVLGPRQLDLDVEAPEEEVRLAETVFLQSEGLLPLIRRVYLATNILFSHRSWTLPHKTNGWSK